MRKLIPYFGLLFATSVAIVASILFDVSAGHGDAGPSGSGSGTISSGTANRIPRYTAATTIGNGTLEDDGAGTMGVPGAAAGAAGTSLQFSGSTAGAVTAAHGAAGGDITFSPGQASNGDGTNKNGGLAGTFGVAGESGGDATGTGTGGAGSTISFAGGPGGAAAGAGGTSGAGGRINYTAGAPGAANGGTAGAYGWHAFTGYAVITGQNDAVQLTVKGNGTQTANVLEVQASDASKKFTVAGDGTVGLPYIFRVSGSTTAATSNSDAPFLFYGGAGGGRGGIFMGNVINLIWRNAATVGTGADHCAISLAAEGVLRMNDTDALIPTWLQQSAARRRRAATQTVTDTTTLAADDTLSITVYSGRKYSGKLCYYFTTTVNSSGAKVDLAGGTATFTSFEGAGKIFSTSAGTFLSTVRMSAATTAVGFTATGTTAYVEIDFSFVCNVGGTFKPQFAQNAETGAAESVVAGVNSFLTMEDMP